MPFAMFLFIYHRKLKQLKVLKKIRNLNRKRLGALGALIVIALMSTACFPWQEYFGPTGPTSTTVSTVDPSSTSTIDPVVQANATKVVVLGDSITDASMASIKSVIGQSKAVKVESVIGLTVDTKGGSLGYNLTDLTTRSMPDVIVINLGTNQTPTMLIDYTKLLAHFRKYVPGVCIVGTTVASNLGPKQFGGGAYSNTDAKTLNKDLTKGFKLPGANDRMDPFPVPTPPPPPTTPTTANPSTTVPVSTTPTTAVPRAYEQFTDQDLARRTVDYVADWDVIRGPYTAGDGVHPDGAGQRKLAELYDQTASQCPPHRPGWVPVTTSTTAAPTTTQAPTTTEAPTTTAAPTTTEAPTTTVPETSTTEAPTSTVPETSTTVPEETTSTTEPVETSTTVPPATEPPSTDTTVPADQQSCLVVPEQGFCLAA